MIEARHTDTRAHVLEGRSMRLKTLAGPWVAPLMAGFYFTGVLAPAVAEAPALAMLASLDKGQWEVRIRDEGASRRLCVQSGLELIQLKHADPGCNRFIVDDGPSAVTVQYTCRGNGYGRTHIRRESPSLVQIESQGIAGGMPFDVSGEARKVGTCH
jgi:hypothetical protein